MFSAVWFFAFSWEQSNFIRKIKRNIWKYVECLVGKLFIGLSVEKLYEMLCYACGYYIFNTDDPFRSVGIEQTALLDMVITRKLGSSISKESVKSAIALVINSRVDRETLHSSLICVLVENLKTPDSKEIAIEQCVALKTELK